MASSLLCVFVFVLLALTERSSERLPLAIASLASLAGALLLVLGDIERSIVLAGLVVAAIVGASRVKHHHSGLKLTAADISLVLAGTVPFLLAQYRRMCIGVLLGAAALLMAAAGTLAWAGGSPLPYEARALLLVTALAACALAYRTGDGAASRPASLSQRSGFLATFMASLIDVSSWWPSQRLRLSDMAEEPLALLPSRPARRELRPDILVLQHESVFDPRLLGLPVDPSIAELLSPARGISGTLNVDIFGGGSWQSELSLLTGLSSASFGADAYFILRKGVGRFHHTLPRSLAALGYHTTFVSSCRRGFLDYDAFYRSIGFAERLFSDDLPPPFDVAGFERTNSDEVFLEALTEVLARRLRRDPGPRFLYALTNANHGPHTRRLAGAGRFEAQRRLAAPALGDLQYVEYAARLAETATSWARMRQQLAALFPDRPMLVVHYGDHQPVMTRRVARALCLPEDDRRCFRTFYAIEGLNMDVGAPGARHGAVLDIAFLGTLALQAAGLPLDPISATRASLIEDCGAAYFASASERKRRFHRTLVQLGLIELAPRVPAAAARAAARSG